MARERQDVRVAIDLLEIPYAVISDVANFSRHLGTNLPLNPQIPLLRIRVAEVVSELKFRRKTRVAFWR